MKLSPRLTGLAAAAVLAGLTGPRIGWSQDTEAMPMENLRIPVEFHPNGRVKVQIKAATARVPLKGSIDASNVTVEMYDEEGNVETVILADRCTFDREKGTATSDSDVKLERADLTISGKGFDWRSGERQMKILADAKVVFNRNIYAKRLKTK